jgi:hypothetical protein
LREVVAQRLEDAPAAGLPVRPVGPELVEKDAVLDVRETGALVDRLELERGHRRRHVHPVEPHVVGVDDAHVLDDVGVGGLEPRHRPVVERRLGHVASPDAEVERPLARLEGVAVAEPLELLVFLGECVPDALEGNGVVAGQGESGAGVGVRLSSFYRLKLTWMVPLSATSVVTVWVSSSPPRPSHSRVPLPRVIGAIIRCK